jgi:hypothetical protein
VRLVGYWKEIYYDARSQECGVTDLARNNGMTLHSVGRKNKVRGFRISSYDVDEVADVKFQFNYSVLLFSKTPRFRRFIAFPQNS